MTYLISQILICLFFTAVIGVIVGWLLRGISAREDIRRLSVRMGGAASAEAGPGAGDERFRAPEDKTEPNIAVRLAAVETVAKEQSRRLAEKAREIVALEDEVAKLKTHAAHPGARVGELLAQLAAAKRALSSLRTTLAERESRLASLEQRQERRGATPAAAAAPARTGPPGKAPSGLLESRPERVDPLQEITGIGPVLERVLNRLGVYQYGQIARLTPENIDWVATHLDWFPGRILRENWVQQAAQLHRQRYPDDPI